MLKKINENVTMPFRVNNEQLLKIIIKYGEKLKG